MQLIGLVMLTLLVALAPLASNALSLDELKPLDYDCQVIMSVKDGTPFFETHFVAPAEGSAHGGEWRSLDVGHGYRIEILADAKWMGIEWSKNNAMIAKGLSVWGAGSAVHRVTFAYNPADIEEMVALTCSLQSSK